MLFPSCSSYLDIVQKKQAERDAALQSHAPPEAHEPYLRATGKHHTENRGRHTHHYLASLRNRAAYRKGRLDRFRRPRGIHHPCHPRTGHYKLPRVPLIVLFAEAREDANSLDREFAATHTLRGPLHGVPVSFKDQYDIRGHDTTLGFTSRADHPAAEDADVVRIIRAAGGIPLAKTNVPQTLFFFECVNPLWGRTLNPHSAAHSSGGSSGGEAALLAMDGSALGWGTDIGGSLRIPASFCGIYSLKPGAGRISTQGMQTTTPGFEGVRTVTGPMGRSVDDLELATRVVLGQGTDSGVAPLPFRDAALPEKLRFGYYLSDDFVKASPANQRAVSETVEALRRVGHECVEIKVPEGGRAMDLFIAMTSADGYKTLTSQLGSDPQEPGLFLVMLGPKLFGWLRVLVAWGLETFLGDSVFAQTIRASRKKDVQEYHKLVAQRDEYEKLFYNEVWEKHQLDGIIAPMIAIPGLPHGSVTQLTPLAGAMIVYNIVDSPVGVVPVTRVAPSDVVGAEWTAGAGHGSPMLEGLVFGDGGAKKGWYDAAAMAGLPVGVQVVGRRWEEEKVLGMMRVVDGALGERGFGPGSWSAQGV